MTGALSRSLLIVAVAFVAVPAWADAEDEAFKNGMAALKDGRWADAADAMRRAIAADPKESTRKVGRVVFVGGDEYLPHFRLGEALLKQGDCAGALAAWEESDKQRVARKVGTNARVIDSGYAGCDAKGFLPPPRFANELQAAGAAYQSASESQQKLADLRRRRAEVKSDTPEEENGNVQLREAYGRLRAGERTRRAEDLVASRAAAQAAARLYAAAYRAAEDAIVRHDAFMKRTRDAEEGLHAAETAAKDLDTRLAKSPVRITLPNTVAADRGRVNGMLVTAAERLRAAARSRSDAEVNEAAKLVQDAGVVLERIRGQLDAEINAAVSAELSALEGGTLPVFAQVEARARAIDEALAQRPDPVIAEEFAKAQAVLQRGQRGFQRALRARDLAGARAAALVPTQVGPQFDSLAARLGIVRTIEVPPGLRQAAQHMFEGRYQEALNSMTHTQAAALAMPLRLHAHLVRAAALFALYEGTGRRDDTLRAQARQEVDVCHSLDSTFYPSRQAFSPRFADFFRTGPPPAR